MSGGGGGAVVGYKYFFGIHAGIGRGEMDELVEIRVGTKLAAQPAMTASGVGEINVPNLFGGDKREGGIKGTFNLMMGEPTQVMPAPLAAMISPVPATGFRRMCTLFYEGLVASLNPYPKPWSFRMRRATKGWDGEVFRPDLAVIELQGPANSGDDEADAYGAEISTTLDIIGPAGNSVRATFNPPAGRKITEMKQVWYDLPELTGVVVLPMLAIELNSDGSATVDVEPSNYGRTLKAEYVHEPTMGGIPEVRQSTGDALIIDNPVYLIVTPHAGDTITGVTSVTTTTYLPDDVIVATVPILGVTLESDGTASVAVPPFYWPTSGNGVVYNATYTRTIGGARAVETSEFYNPYPIVFDIIAPSNGLLTEIVSISRVTRVGNSNSGEGADGYPPILDAVPFTAEENTVTTYDPRVSGATLAVVIKYRPSLNNDQTFTPIRLIKAMNPAHIIFECLTNREWGRGLDRSLLDQNSFATCAQTLYDESFGMCLRWTRRDSIDSFIQEILDTIGATLFMDRSNALMTLRLIRKDYNVGDLKLWDVNNGILAITNSQVNTSSVVINEVIVKYREAVFNEDRAVNVQNLASLQSGSFKTMTKTYKGIPTSGLARRVAQRDLRANAEGLRRFTITMDRRGSSITPGHVMRIQDVSRSIFPTVVRVATVKSDGPTSGVITLAVVQDVFAFPEKAFVQDQPNTWVPPNFKPCVGIHEVFEAPYFLLNNIMPQADFSFLDNQSAYFLVVAEQAKRSNTGYDIAVRAGAPEAEDIPTNSAAMYCGYEGP